MYDREYVWHLKTLDGSYALLNENQSACQYGNELTRSGVQHKTRDEYHGKCGIDEGDGHLRPQALLLGMSYEQLRPGQ